MKKGDVVLGGLLPAHQDAPESVQPTVGAFHHPAPGSEPSLSFDGLSFFASLRMWAVKPNSSTMRRTSGKSYPLSRHIPWGCAGLGVGRDIGRRSTVTRTSFMSWRLAPSTARPTGTHWASVNRLRLTPRLPRSVGLAPVFPRPRETWSWHRPGSPNSSPAPSVRHSVPVPPATVPGTPQRRPILESAGGRWTRSRCPWRPRLSTGSRCAARRRFHWRRYGREPAAGPAEPMGVHTLGDQGRQHFPQLVGDLERAGGGIGFGGRASTLRTRRLRVFRFGHYPSLDATLTSHPPMGRHVSASY